MKMLLDMCHSCIMDCFVKRTGKSLLKIKCLLRILYSCYIFDHWSTGLQNYFYWKNRQARKYFFAPICNHQNMLQKSLKSFYQFLFLITFLPSLINNSYIKKRQGLFLLEALVTFETVYGGLKNQVLIFLSSLNL